MKRNLLCGLGLVSISLALGLVGCGGGIEQGLPKDPTKTDVPLTPDMVDVTGKMGTGAAKSAASKAAQAQRTNPTGETPDEKK